MKKGAKNRSADPEKSASTMNLDLILKIVGALVAVVGVVFGFYQYNQRKVETQESRKYQHYIKATTVAASFAQASTKQEADEKSKQFWEIYYGELSMVEDENVKQAMQNFGGAVKQWEKYNSNPESDFSSPAMFELEDAKGEAQTFDQLAYQLSLACRQSLEQ